VALCLGIYGDPRGAWGSYERGTPVAVPHSGWPTILKLTRWACGTNSATLVQIRQLWYKFGNFGAKQSPVSPYLLNPFVFLFFITLDAGHERSSSLELSDTKVCEP